MPSLEKQEGWGNRLVALQQAGKLGHGFVRPVENRYDYGEDRIYAI
jgi:hypothetical protein